MAVRNTTYGAHGAGASVRYDGNWIYEARFGPGVRGGVTVPDTDVGNALDVVGHELSHQVARISNTLQCNDDSTCGFSGMGLNEGFADVAAIATDFSFTRPFPWTIGEEAFSSGLAYRDAAAPIFMNFFSRDYWPHRSMAKTSEGGAHQNATIVSHAYYLLVNGGTHYLAGTSGIPTIQVPALGRNKAEKIFYGALIQGSFSQNSTFDQAKTLTANRALGLYGQAEKDATIAAWEAVGVSSCSNVPAIPNITASMLFCPWWTISLTPVQGATTYHSQYATNGAFNPASTWHDSSDTSDCEAYPFTRTFFRARACNACGCSAWSQQAQMYPWIGECP